MTNMWNEIVNKRIWIFPNDSYRKIGTVMSVDEHGIWIKSDDLSEDEVWKNGEIHFYGWANSIDFIVEDDSPAWKRFRKNK